MRELIDQMDRRVKVGDQPQRIISLVPSQTELLYDLGLEDQLVGLTKFCVHPRGLKKTKAIIGGTKTYRYDLIRSLQPDLIIGNKEENAREGIEKLSAEFPVWMSDISRFEESLDMIIKVGQLTSRQEQADYIVDQISNNFKLLRPSHQERVVYLIWNNPLMVAGKGTFIDDMLAKCGFVNCIDRQRYPGISKQELFDLAPDRILLSSEPFPFKEKHIEAFRHILPKTKIQLVDGEMFSWYGSRLVYAPSYFLQLM
jgi:ABC-type Fe3+-hydroxamate transport system substrate-binding protein